MTPQAVPMALRIGLAAERSQAGLAAARAWFTERAVDVVVTGDEPRAGFWPLMLAADEHGGDDPVTVLVAGPRPPEQPLVVNAALATGAPTVVVGGYAQTRPSRAAGPVLELGHGITGIAQCWCAMVEVARGDHGTLWVWQEAGRLGGRDGAGHVLSAIVEAWMHDGVQWRLRSEPVHRDASRAQLRSMISIL
jgi:hypothetical protein